MTKAEDLENAKKELNSVICRDDWRNENFICRKLYYIKTKL